MLRTVFIILCLLQASLSLALSSSGEEFHNDDANFLTSYSRHSDTHSLPSGLLYRVLHSGDKDASPVDSDQACSVRYKGTTLRGEVFLSSEKLGKQASLLVPKEVSLMGFREALSAMKEGDHWEVVIPAHLGYGDLTMGKQALGMAVLVIYAGYAYFENKGQMGKANAAPTLHPKDHFDRPDNAVVFLKIAIGNEILDRIEIELFTSVCPKTAENFRCLCTGEKGMCKTTSKGQKDIPLHLKDSVFHRVIPGFMCQGGDITNRDGTGGESIYGPSFADEWDNGVILHSEPYLLSMANCGIDTNSSQFFLTTNPTAWLDRKHVVFGRVKRGMATVKAMEAVGSSGGGTSKLVRVIDCGEIERFDCKED